jgi:hypothetical protein
MCGVWFFLFIIGLTSVVGLRADTIFQPPARGFISTEPARNWQHSLLTGNGTMGALVVGNPYDETIFLSHAALYLPNTNSDRYLNMASRLSEIRALCLAMNFAGAASQIDAAKAEYSYSDARDPFIAACALHVKQPESKLVRYQRAVNFMTAEASVSVADAAGDFRRDVFVSRADDVIVLRLAGQGKQSAEFSFAAVPVTGEKDMKLMTNGVREVSQGVRDGLLYFRTIFARTNRFNPNLGYEVAGKIIRQGGEETETTNGISISNADEILLLVKIQPLLKSAGVTSNFKSLARDLAALTNSYDELLARSAKLHGDLMGRVSFSLSAPAADRAKPSEELNKESETLDAPLAKIERAFDAGRYNIICCTGYNPPNLQGLWSGTWNAPWSGSFTANGNLPAAVAFDLMGNTPELMQPYFRFYEDRLAGFRENARAFYGMRGFHVPAQMTLSPLETDFTPKSPHCFWHAGAAWAAQFYFDYYQYTGDKKFLAERAYPFMKEAAEFYEDFLTVTNDAGKFVFVPSYSPENTPGGEKKIPTAINATMDVAAAKQLLNNLIIAAKILGLDGNLQARWSAMLAKMPDYEVGPDGSFREWLWPGLDENNQHRHASHLYALFDGEPPEICDHTNLVNAVEHTIRERLKFREAHRTGMAFGVVQLGLAAEHVGNAELAGETINLLAKRFWSDGMASFHDQHNLFNMDISGGFPYLCANALVYADPGCIKFFPARPVSWTQGSITGLRLRGAVVLRELTWDKAKSGATLVSDLDQTVTVQAPGGFLKLCKLKAGEEYKLEF